MSENELYLVKENIFDNPIVQKIDSPIDNSIRGCHHKYFHTFDHICEFDLNFTKSLIRNQLISQLLIKT